MAKNDNAQSVRLVESLERQIGYDTAREFEANFPLSKSADIEKKYQWAKTVCIILKNILIPIPSLRSEKNAAVMMANQLQAKF